MTGLFWGLPGFPQCHTDSVTLRLPLFMFMTLNTRSTLSMKLSQDMPSLFLSLTSLWNWRALALLQTNIAWSLGFDSQNSFQDGDYLICFYDIYLRQYFSRNGTSDGNYLHLRYSHKKKKKKKNAKCNI